MALKKNRPPEDEGRGPYDHPSQDRTDRFAVDALLRKHGYTIHSRKAGKPPLWRARDGRVVSFMQACLELKDRHELADARLLEEWYLCSYLPLDNDGEAA